MTVVAAIVAIAAIVMTPVVMIAPGMASMIVPAAIVVVPVVATIMATAIMILTMPVVIAVARGCQREAAGGGQGECNEQAVDEFHLGSPPWASCRNKAASDGTRRIVGMFG